MTLLLNPADPVELADLVDPADSAGPAELHAPTLMTAAIAPMASGAASFLEDATVQSHL